MVSSLASSVINELSAAGPVLRFPALFPRPFLFLSSLTGSFPATSPSPSSFSQRFQEWTQDLWKGLSLRSFRATMVWKKARRILNRSSFIISQRSNISKSRFLSTNPRCQFFYSFCAFLAPGFWLMCNVDGGSVGGSREETGSGTAEASPSIIFIRVASW